MTDTKVPKEIQDLISHQRRHDPRMKRQKIECTPYAVRCTRHGRVVLDWDEGSAAAVSAESPKCPVEGCGRDSHMDSYWYEKTKHALGYV